METVFFLIIVGVCAMVVVWAARRSRTKTDLAGKPPENLLTTPPASRLSHRDEVWQTRLDQAARDVSKLKPFVARFEATDEPEYDGFSRRSRHHLATAGQVADEAHIEDKADPSARVSDTGVREHVTDS